MITFNVKSLQNFQSRTQYIKPNTILPALANLKLEYRDGKHYLTKNNLRCVCVVSIEAEGSCPDLLLNERIFHGFINKSKAETIRMKWDDQRILLSDGKQVAEFASEPAENFPKTPDYSKTQIHFKFLKPHLEAIGLARKFVNDSDTGGNFRFVHITDGFIAGIHNNFFYINNKFDPFPNMLIDTEMADVLTNGEEFDVAITGNQYFFLANDVIYIFTQYEGSTPRIRQAIWDKLSTPGKEFQFAKENLVDFCELSNIICDSELVRFHMEQKNGSIFFTMKDGDKNRGNVKNCPMTGEMDKIAFDSRMYGSAFRNIPYETLKCKTTNNCLIINNDGGKEYFCFQGLQQ